MICIFGAGSYGYEVYELLLRDGTKEEMIFCDNYILEKETLHGVKIVDFAALKQMSETEKVEVIISAATRYREIAAQCRDAGLHVKGVYHPKNNSIVSYEKAGAQLEEWDMRSVLAANSRYVMIENIYHTDFEKNCLLLYIFEPFLYKTGIHTNETLANLIAETFRDRSYNVDAARFSTEREFDFGKYDVVLGFGEQFDKALAYAQDHPLVTIAFLTGASPYHNNMAVLRRFGEFCRRNKTELRLKKEALSSPEGGLMNIPLLRCASAAICVGNAWTKSTYEDMLRRIYLTTSVGMKAAADGGTERNLEAAQKNFLWFGGSTTLHKGLDLCIEAFRICGGG